MNKITILTIKKNLKPPQKHTIVSSQKMPKSPQKYTSISTKNLEKVHKKHVLKTLTHQSYAEVFMCFKIKN